MNTETMSTEMVLLVWTIVLALVQTMLPALLRTKEVSLPYAASPRDVPAPVKPGILTGRLMRAQQNLLETLPLFIALVLAAHILQKESALTYWGAMLYFWGRVAHLPLYAAGVPYLRTLVFFASIVGLVLLIAALL